MVVLFVREMQSAAKSLARGKRSKNNLLFLLVARLLMHPTNFICCSLLRALVTPNLTLLLLSC